MTRMEIPDDISLPDVCLTCPRPTGRRDKILSKEDRDKEPTWFNFLGHLSLVFWSPACAYAEYGDMNGTSPTVINNIPRCADCASRGRMIPVDTDFHEKSMTFIVQ
jgi:hypothetical protein